MVVKAFSLDGIQGLYLGSELLPHAAFLPPVRHIGLVTHEASHCGVESSDESPFRQGHCLKWHQYLAVGD